jgi:hypothetical protein
MKVKCIEIGNFKGLITVGKEYKVEEIALWDDAIVIIHDKNHKGMFPIHLFEF